jgi:rare lipoprotein A
LEGGFELLVRSTVARRGLGVLFAALLACAVGAVVFGGRAQAEEGLASWYGPGFEGQLTASGAPYDPYGFTAASKTLPLGTELVVSYNGLSVPVTINDRGPYAGDREIDLSQGAAEYLGLIQAGVDYVDYQYAGFDPTTNLYATGAYDEQYSAGVEQYAAEDQYGVDSYYGIQSDYSTALPGTAEPAVDPAAEPAVDPAVVEGTGAGSYVAQPGDTLSGIAANLGTTVESLAAVNGIPNPDLIYAGQTLYY